MSRGFGITFIVCSYLHFIKLFLKRYLFAHSYMILSLPIKNVSYAHSGVVLEFLSNTKKIIHNSMASSHLEKSTGGAEYTDYISAEW